MNVVVSHWPANAAVLAVAAAVTAVHLRGLHGMAADARWRGGDLPRGLGREVAAFYGGLCVVVLALLSPLAYWPAHYLWVRSVQDVLLANLAPVFLVLGGALAGAASRSSVSDAARARAGGWSRPGARARAGRAPEAGRAARLARMSVLTVIAFNAAWCGWHLPVLFEVAIVAAMIASYVVTKHIPVMALVTGAVVLVFGTLTLVLHDETFIKMKPTIVYSLFAAVLGGGEHLDRLRGGDAALGPVHRVVVLRLQVIADAVAWPEPQRMARAGCEERHWR